MIIASRPYFTDTWASNSDNQLVTNKAIRNAIENGVFQTKAGQTVPDDRRVPTKNEVLTWLNIQSNNPYLFVKASNEPVAKRDLVKNFENTAQLYGVPWKGGFNGWNTAIIACNSYIDGFTAEVYWDGVVNDPAIVYGKFIGTLTTGRWYYLNGFAIQIDATPSYNSLLDMYSFTVTNATSCGGGGPTTGSYFAEKYICGSCQYIEAAVVVNGATSLTLNNFYTGNDGFIYKITSTAPAAESPVYISGGWSSCASVPCQ